MPEIVFHPEPTNLGTDTYHTNDGALAYILAFPLIVALVLVMFFRRTP